jgi:hypothetical protein
LKITCFPHLIADTISKIEYDINNIPSRTENRADVVLSAAPSAMVGIG